MILPFFKIETPHLNTILIPEKTSYQFSWFIMQHLIFFSLKCNQHKSILSIEVDKNTRICEKKQLRINRAAIERRQDTECSENWDFFKEKNILI